MFETSSPSKIVDWFLHRFDENDDDNDGPDDGDDDGDDGDDESDDDGGVKGGLVCSNGDEEDAMKDESKADVVDIFEIKSDDDDVVNNDVIADCDVDDDDDDDDGDDNNDDGATNDDGFGNDDGKENVEANMTKTNKCHIIILSQMNLVRSDNPDKDAKDGDGDDNGDCDKYDEEEDDDVISPDVNNRTLPDDLHLEETNFNFRN